MLEHNLEVLQLPECRWEFEIQCSPWQWGPGPRSMWELLYLFLTLCQLLCCQAEATAAPFTPQSCNLDCIQQVSWRFYLLHSQLLTHLNSVTLYNSYSIMFYFLFCDRCSLSLCLKSKKNSRLKIIHITHFFKRIIQFVLVLRKV